MCIYAVHAAARIVNAETFVDSFTLVRICIKSCTCTYTYICRYAVHAAAQTTNAETLVDTFSLVRIYIY